MNNFTDILRESRKTYDSESLLLAEVEEFIHKVNKILPTNVKDVIHLTKKYNILDRESIEIIRTASKSSLKKLADQYKIDLINLENLWRLLKELKQNIYLLPQYMSPQEREELEKGKLATNDLTIDLESSAGRNAVTKMYMPLVYKIVNQYVGKSNLSKAELISAGVEGFTRAMNEWDRLKGVPFKTYAGTRVRQQILNEINGFSHSLSGFNDYAFKKGDTADAFSLDNMLTRDNDGDFKQDRLAALGTTDNNYMSDDKFDELYNLIEKKFSQRDIVIFYRYFGLNGYQKVKSKELAKEFGWSEGNIRNSVINKIIKFIRTNPKAQEILDQLNESYNISLMVGLIGMDRDYIIETLCGDDIFILLEELNKWSDPEYFDASLQQSLSSLTSSELKTIQKILDEDFNYLDSVFKKYKKLIILFLSNMYPTEPMNRKTDVALLEYMVEIQEAYKKHFK